MGVNETPMLVPNVNYSQEHDEATTPISGLMGQGLIEHIQQPMTADDLNGGEIHPMASDCTSALSPPAAVLNRISCCEYFVNKLPWMRFEPGHQYGDIRCPKSLCNAKIGVFNTNPQRGLLCTCGTRVAPGYLIFKSTLKTGFNQVAVEMQQTTLDS